MGNLPQTMVRKWVLLCYEKWSELKINYHKAPQFSQEKFQLIAFCFLISLVFNCLVQRLSITYLELSLNTGRLSKLYWKPRIKKIQKRLARWKGKLLSLGGRVTMINQSYLSMYFISFFSLSRRVEREIDTLRRKFLWDGTQKEGKGFCLISWKRVCKRRKFGGLGITNLWNFNKALHIKL